MRLFNKCVDIMGCLVGGSMIGAFAGQLDTARGVILFSIGVFFLCFSMVRLARSR